jgi:hypothetical protein
MAELFLIQKGWFMLFFTDDNATCQLSKLSDSSTKNNVNSLSCLSECKNNNKGIVIFLPMGMSFITNVNIYKASLHANI